MKLNKIIQNYFLKPAIALGITTGVATAQDTNLDNIKVYEFFSSLKPMDEKTFDYGETYFDMNAMFGGRFGEFLSNKQIWNEIYSGNGEDTLNLSKNRIYSVQWNFEKAPKKTKLSGKQDDGLIIVDAIERTNDAKSRSVVIVPLSFEKESTNYKLTGDVNYLDLSNNIIYFRVK
jgi:hypothetical protein